MREAQRHAFPAERGGLFGGLAVEPEQWLSTGRADNLDIVPADWLRCSVVARAKPAVTRSGGNFSAKN